MVEKQYTVREGDSLYQIGKNLGTVPEGIYILNHLKSDRLEIGQKLWIPSYVEAQVLYEDTPVYHQSLLHLVHTFTDAGDRRTTASITV